MFRVLLILALAMVVSAGGSQAKETKTCSKNTGDKTYPWRCSYGKSVYKCKSSYTTDGCSTGHVKGVGKKVTKKYNGPFYSACRGHDMCYAFSKGKKSILRWNRCNEDFKMAMMMICARMKLKDRAGCAAAADAYYLGVGTRDHWKSFKRARKWRADNCRKM